MGNSSGKRGVERSEEKQKTAPTNRIQNQASESKVHQPGEGIRSMQTSSVFRALNFELYAKPNKTIMGIGLVGITLSFGYLLYMRYNYDSQQYYEAISEDGSVTLRPKKSRWDS